jgi:hypothetical protein
MHVTLPPVTPDMPTRVRGAANDLHERREAAHKAATDLQSHERRREAAEQRDREVARDAVDAGKPMPDPEHLPAWERERTTLARTHEAFADAVQLREQRLREAIDEARSTWTKAAAKQTVSCLADARAKLATLEESMNDLTTARAVEAWLSADGEATWRPERAMPRTPLIGRQGDRVPLADALAALRQTLDLAEATPAPQPVGALSDDQLRAGGGVAGLSLRAVG